MRREANVEKKITICSKGKNQERLLQELMQAKKNVTLILLKGFHIKGIIQGYDVYSILIEVNGKQQLVYKHAISTISL
ncbi:RNA chaperone Hfq [Bacillus tropicus]|uniref:RNA chaperone Hfq n=1 Tax=Bacillus tropicus TaxID=2026188 RepID=UPI002E212A36|nr:RNA chaperone Hfq [Bacillus tropicus]